MSAAFETIVGKVCVERGWVTRDQLVDCLRQVATTIDVPSADSSQSRLSDMLISRGLVTPEQMTALRDEVSRILATDSAYTVVRRGDTALGQILVSAGACTKEQVIEALSIQQHLADKGGPAPRLGELLLQKGLVSFAAIERALESQNGKTLLHCVSCRSQYAVVDFSPRKKYLCKKCSGSLLPPGELPPDIPEEVATAQTNPRNVLGKYVLIRELGRGGMGVVYKAWESPLKRWVALKVLIGTGGQEELIRFRREAQTAASLRHPGIVGIFEVGDIGDKHVIAMEYVDGKSLAGEKLPAPRAAEILVQVARAVEFAHSRGIIHRDLKPHNIMIDLEGKPYVMDFGLAKSLQGHSQITMSGTVVGTPSYMAPEQAAGNVSLIGKPSDVYSLGAVLYELLTGLPPFKGPNPVETLRRVVNEDVAPPSRLNAAVPPDLETIVLKCLEKDVARRYPNAAALAEDLEHFRGGKAIVARRDHAAVVVGRRMKRQWVPILAVAATLALALLGAFVATRGPAKAEEVRALIQTGGRMAVAGDLQAALTKFEAARALDPENKDIQGLIAEITERIRSTDKNELLKREEARGKAQPEIDLGRTKLQRAITLFYQQGADFSRLSTLLAEAVEHFTRALALLPASPDLLHLRGQARALQQNPTEAEKDFSAAIKALKTFSAAYYDRARLYLALAAEEDSQSWRDKARADLESYRKTGAGDREQAEFAEALLAASEHQPAKVLQLCDRLIGRQTTNEEVFKLKGDAFAEMALKAEGEKRTDLLRQAVLSQTEALTRRVNYPEACLARGNASLALGKFAEAIADWERAIALGIPRAEALQKKIAEARVRVGG
ncbi:MAG: protein kinase [Planctomycetaceae bacterium]|nr:protein kinase [Planctomycetaceae bacterium]